MRSLAVLLSLAASGCLIGGGPVLAVRAKAKSKVAIGWEASSNVFGLGAEGGQTYSLGSSATSSYGAFRATMPLQPSKQGTDQYLAGIDLENAAHLNVMLGYGGMDGDRGLAAGVAPMMVFGDRNCFTGSTLWSVSVGIRSISGVTELYVAPKVNSHLPAPCD